MIGVHVLEFMPEEILALCVDPIEDVKVPPMPRLYAREFETGMFALNGVVSDVRFVAVGSRARPDLKMLKGAIDHVRSACDIPVVAVSPSLDYWQKEWLASRQVPFIQNERNAYLPFMGLVVQDTSRGRRPSPLSPQAQRIVVNLIEGVWDDVSAGGLSKRVGKSRASVSKYLSEIEAICPEVVRRSGRSTMLARNGMGNAALLDRFEPYLRSPVSRRFRISYGVVPGEFHKVGARLSGLSALGCMSDLSIGEAYPTVAIPQEGLAGAMAALGEAGRELPWWDEEGTDVEVWAYWDDLPADLQGRSVGGLSSVGRLSLYLSLRERFQDDVRVTDAIDQLREEICR